MNYKNFYIIFLVIFISHVFTSAHELKTPRNTSIITHTHPEDIGWWGYKEGIGEVYDTKEGWTSWSDDYYYLIPKERIAGATQTYNCYAFAWAGVTENINPNYICWVDEPDNYIGDGSYDEVDLSSGSIAYYTVKGHSLQITGGTYNGGPEVISKWGKLPLYKHRLLEDCYLESSQNTKYYRRSIDVPQDHSSINNAISAAVYGQTCVVSLGNYTLTGNITLSSGVTLTLGSGANINFNGYYIDPGCGIFNINNGATVYVKSSGRYYNLTNSIQSAINSASSGMTIELLSTSYSEGPSISSKSSIYLFGQGPSSTIINNSISITNSSSIIISGMRIANGVYSTNSQYVNVYSCDFPGSTLFCDYGSTSSWVSASTATTGSASFAVSLYGGSGYVYSANIENFDCGVFLSNNASYVTGEQNTFCNNGIDICAQNGAYAYAASNIYSYALPNSVYGNVFTTGTNGVCNLPKNIPIELAEPKSWESKALKEADEKYISLLRKIDEEKKKGGTDRNKFSEDFNSLLLDYKNIVKEENNKQVFKAALSKVGHLYKARDEKDLFADYLGNLKASVDQQFIPYINRYAIWNEVDKNNFNNSMYIADDVIKSAAGDEDLLCEMIYEKGIIYKYYLNKAVKAGEQFAEIISKHPKHILAKYASMSSGIKTKEPFAFETSEKVEVTNYSIDNYPNPFNPMTTISYSIPQAGYVVLKVYDVLGREVAELINGVKEKGRHSVMFNASKYSSGFYIYTIKVNDFYASKKMLLTK